MTVRAVVLDRDGVLTTIDRERLRRDVLSRLPLDEDEVARRWRAFTAARVSRHAADEERTITEFFWKIAEELALDVDARIALLALDYTSCVRAYPDARAALIEARRRDLRVGVLTNNSAALSPTRMLAATGLSTLVDVALSAQMIGARKPDPAAYRAIAAALDVAPDRCLFFDDDAARVEGARAVGMEAYRVDRARGEHDVDAGVVADLSALVAILERGARR